MHKIPTLWKLTCENTKFSTTLPVHRKTLLSTIHWGIKNMGRNISWGHLFDGSNAPVREKSKRDFPLRCLGTPNHLHLTEALSATRGKSREKHAPPSPAAPTLNTWGDSSGKPRRAMKRHSTKTDLATDQCSGKEGNAPQNPHLTAEKTYLSSLSDSGDCGKRWKLGIHSKIAVEKYRNVRFPIAQNRKQASAWPGN